MFSFLKFMIFFFIFIIVVILMLMFVTAFIGVVILGKPNWEYIYFLLFFSPSQNERPSL